MATATGGLSIRGLSKSFQGLQALDTVDLDIAEGASLGLIGPNGSGKTTLFNLITGIYPPDQGEIHFGDEVLAGRSAHEIFGRGVARTFQNLRLFEHMTVYENVRSARHAANAPGGLLWMSGAARKNERDAIMGYLETAGLADRAHDLPSALPLAGQRRLEVARALAAEPRLLLLDEPAGGMTPRETVSMAEALARHVLPGRTVILIEHKIDMIADLCPRLCVLNFGRKIADGETNRVLRAREVVEAYLGSGPVGEEGGHAGG